MSLTVAVTGATGFIGREVCRQLLAAGHSVRALARSEARSRGLAASGAQAMLGNLEDLRALGALVAGADAVVHCAGAVRGATRAAFDAVNVDGLRRLLGVLEAQPVPPRLLALSSLAAREPGLSHYAASKRAGEEVLDAEARAVSWAALRPPAVYGPGDRELLALFRAMARGLGPIPGSPEARFSMLFVSDLAAAVLAWLRAAPPVEGVFPLDDGRPGGYGWREVADTVSTLCRRRVRLLRLPATALDLAASLNRWAAPRLGYAPMLTPEKLRELRHPDWVCDGEKWTAQTGWRPAVRLAEGLRRTPGWPGYVPEAVDAG